MRHFIKCTSRSPTTEHSLRTLRHVYETCCCHQLTKSKYSWSFPPSTEDPSIGSPSDLRSATCRRTRVLITEHVDTNVSRRHLLKRCLHTVGNVWTVESNVLFESRSGLHKLGTRRPQFTITVANVSPDVFAARGQCSLSTTQATFSFSIDSNLFLHFSECDIVPRHSQRRQPGVTPCSSTHLCVMYCLLTCGSLAAPSGLGFVGTMRSKASLLQQWPFVNR